VRCHGCLRMNIQTLVLGDGAVDVGDDDLVVPAPQVDGALAAARPLVLRGGAEGDVIRPLSQLQAGLQETDLLTSDVYSIIMSNSNRYL